MSININKRSLKVIIAIVFITVFVISLFYKKKEDLALKNYDFVKATIVKIAPSRSSTIIYVEYFYNGIKIRNDFSVTQDSFMVKENVLLKVAKQHPDRYIKFVHIIR